MPDSEEELSINDGEVKRYALGRIAIEAEIVPKEQLPDKIPEKIYTKWLDDGKIKDNCVFRKTLPGDFLVIDSAGHRKKVADYLKDEKVPKRKRGEVICLASGSLVHWVVGHRIGESCRIEADTKKAVKFDVTALNDREEL